MTHTRLFTFDSLCRLLEEGGFRILLVRGIPAPFPLVVKRRPLAQALVALNGWLIKLSRSLFSYQVLVVCRPLPSVSMLLRTTHDHTRERLKAGGLLG